MEETLTNALSIGDLGDIESWERGFGVPGSRHAVVLPHFSNMPRGIGYEMQFETSDASYIVSSTACDAPPFSPWSNLIPITESAVRLNVSRHMSDEGAYPYSNEMPVVSVICDRGPFLDMHSSAILGHTIENVVAMLDFSRTELFMKRDGSIALLDRDGNTILGKVYLPPQDPTMALDTSLRTEGAGLVICEVHGVGFSSFGMIGDGYYFVRTGAWDRNEEWEWVGIVECDERVRPMMLPD